MKLPIAFALLASLYSTGCGTGQKKTAAAKEPSFNMQTASAQNPATAGSMELATLGGGCFWCVEAIYQDIKGVLKVESGYAGGHVSNPTYKEVCAGVTGHAEVVQVTFDPAVVAYADILRVFFTVHDPTTLNRQGNDVGTQYRSIILYHSPEQKKIAEEVKKEAQEIWDGRIVTEISAYDKFYKAEDYHQNYFKDNPNQPYCSIVIAPKVKKFREKYKDLLKQ